MSDDFRDMKNQGQLWMEQMERDYHRSRRLQIGDFVLKLCLTIAILVCCVAFLLQVWVEHSAGSTPHKTLPNTPADVKEIQRDSLGAALIPNPR